MWAMIATPITRAVSQTIFVVFTVSASLQLPFPHPNYAPRDVCRGVTRDRSCATKTSGLDGLTDAASLGGVPGGHQLPMAG
jgi:hypothetical protein